MRRLHPDDIGAIARAVVAELAATYLLRQGSNAQDAPDWMSPKELASQIRVSLTTLRTWRLERQGPRWARFGQRVRYSRSDVAAWLEAVGGATLADASERAARTRRR